MTISNRDFSKDISKNPKNKKKAISTCIYFECVSQKCMLFSIAQVRCQLRPQLFLTDPLSRISSIESLDSRLSRWDTRLTRVFFLAGKSKGKRGRRKERSFTWRQGDVHRRRSYQEVRGQTWWVTDVITNGCATLCMTRVTSAHLKERHRALSSLSVAHDLRDFTACRRL